MLRDVSASMASNHSLRFGTGVRPAGLGASHAQSQQGAFDPLAHGFAATPNEWASAVILEILTLAKARSMSVGYIEFANGAMPFHIDPHGEDQRGALNTDTEGPLDRGDGEQKLWCKDVDKIWRVARQAECRGATNYEAPIAAALDAFDSLQLPPSAGTALSYGSLGRTASNKGVAPAFSPRTAGDLHIVFLTDGQVSHSITDELLDVN